MGEYIYLMVSICVVLVGLTAIYHLSPFKRLGGTKPKLVFLPKYEFAVTDSKLMSVGLDQLGFKEHKSKNNLFLRGMLIGDFSANLAKLQVFVDETKNTGYLKAPFIGILFDTGDLWSIAAQLDQKSAITNSK